MKPIALQLYSVRQEAQADFEKTLRTVASYGYDGVEFAGLFGHAPEKVRDLCKKYNLTPISAHVPLDDMTADPEALFSAYETIGCRYVAIPSLPESRIPGGDLFGQTAQTITALAAVAKKHGITLLYHNHDFEFVKLGATLKLDLFYAAIPADVIATEIDTCWAKVGGVDPAEYVKKYAGRAPVVHLKDFFGEKSEDMYELISVKSQKPRRPGNFSFRPIGHGLQNVPSILAAADEAGAEWLVVEQDNPSMDLSPLACAKASIDYLRSL